MLDEWHSSFPGVGDEPFALESPDSKEVETFYRLLQQAHRRFGASRIEIGALLEVIRSRKLWQGKASSFGAFLEEERLNDSAAYQYMRVARKFFYELKLSDSELDEISTVNMKLLDMATRVITPDNKDEVLGIVICLGERDARAELEAIAAGMPPPDEPMRPRSSPRVARLYSDFRSLPDDQRIEFLQKLRLPNSHHEPDKGEST